MRLCGNDYTTILFSYEFTKVMNNQYTKIVKNYAISLL